MGSGKSGGYAAAGRELYAVGLPATKVPPFASERKAALTRFGFAATQEKLIGGHDKRAYGDYSILQKVR